MKLCTFTHNDTTRIGVVMDESVVDLSAAAPTLPTEMCAFLEAGAAAMATARTAADTGDARIPLADVTLEAPVLRPPEFLAVGINYADHVEEAGMDTPTFPVIFNKQATCVTGPYHPVHVPRASSLVDYEGELGVVIGTRCRHVSKEDAPKVIAGYTIVNDASVRDWQFKSATWTLGKSWDTHGPCGPYLVTADEVGDPHDLNLKTMVNGEPRQESNTKHLIFDCYALIETLSTVMTLLPGMLIATGTPSGIGAVMNPPSFLKPGDVVRIEIDKLGHIENPHIAEPDDTAHIG